MIRRTLLLLVREPAGDRAVAQADRVEQRNLAPGDRTDACLQLRVHLQNNLDCSCRLTRTRRCAVLCCFAVNTTVQVTAAAMAATVWCMRNPREGIKEPEQIPHDEILGIMQPYIAPVIGEYTDWTPLHQRETLFKEVRAQPCSPGGLPMVCTHRWLTAWAHSCVSVIRGLHSAYDRVVRVLLQDIDKEDPWQFKNVIVGALP